LPEAITLAARFAHKWEAQGDFLNQNQSATNPNNQPKQPTPNLYKKHTIGVHMDGWMWMW